MAQEGSAEAAMLGHENGNAKAAAVVFASMKPQLMVPEQKAEEAVEFYKAAFGADEVRRVNHPKRKSGQDAPFLLCAEIKIGSSSLLVCGGDAPQTKPNEGVVFRLETEDVQAAVTKGVNAGATLHGELLEADGPCDPELSGKLIDPFGQVWVVACAGKNCAPDA